MDFEEALHYMEGLIRFGWKLGNERFEALCARLGNPQDKYSIVHVAGTKGKGSTTALAAAVLQHSGYRGTGSDMASSFASYGQRVSGPQVGAIAVMGRRGGGHVGIITGIDAADAMPETKVFQAGTRQEGKTILTDGGRVLSVTSLGSTIAQAAQRAYAAMGKIHFDGIHYRRDIAHQAIGSSAT